jgi:hypothetical protein
LVFLDHGAEKSLADVRSSPIVKLGPMLHQVPETSGEDVVLAIPGGPASVQPAEMFRSTWIVQSLESLRTSPHWDDYLASLREHRTSILTCVAGMWMPIAVARAHYEACDSLGLRGDEVAALGNGSGSELRRSWYAPFIAAAKSAPSPWATLTLLDRMWHRSADGGAVGVYRLGPKQARIEYVGCELLDVSYFRHAVRTVLHALAEHFAERPVVRVLPQPASAQGHFLMTWS